MNCPLFVDYTRECIEHVKIVPLNTLTLCSTKKFKECPFYMMIQQPDAVCKNTCKCLVYKKFSVSDVGRFIKMTQKYCANINHERCKRYILKEAGQPVPENLHPNGRRIK